MKERRKNQIRSDEYYFSEPIWERGKFIIKAGSESGRRNIRIAELTPVDIMLIMVNKDCTSIAYGISSDQKILSFTDLQEVLDLTKTRKNIALTQILHFLPILDEYKLYQSAEITSAYKRLYDKEEVTSWEIINRLATIEKEKESEQ